MWHRAWSVKVKHSRSEVSNREMRRVLSTLDVGNGPGQGQAGGGGLRPGYRYHCAMLHVFTLMCAPHVETNGVRGNPNIYESK